MYEIKMPKLGMMVLMGKVNEWKVKDGSSVKEGDELAEIAAETEKLTFVILAKTNGVLKIITKEGVLVDCGKVIATIE